MDSAIDHADRRERLAHGGFDAFYREHWDRLYRTLALTIRDSDLAREAVDEAMVRALSKWRYLRSGPNPPGWVYRVAHNWAIDQIRRQGREIDGRGLGSDLAWTPTTPRPDLTEQLNNLSTEQRAVVILRVVNDWSEQQVAEALGIPVGTVKSRLSRALETLRQEVEDL